MNEWIGSLYGWRRKKPERATQIKRIKKKKKNTKNLTEHLHLPTSISKYTFILSLSLSPSHSIFSSSLFLYSEFSCWFLFLSLYLIHSFTLDRFCLTMRITLSLQTHISKKMKKKKEKKIEWPQWEEQNNNNNSTHNLWVILYVYAHVSVIIECSMLSIVKWEKYFELHMIEWRRKIAVYKHCLNVKLYQL